MNLPNKISLIRLLLIPVFAVLFWVDFPYHYLASTIVFVIASMTDFIDGNIARKYNMVTDLGKFLDSVADKALVCTALVLITSLENIFTFIIVVFAVVIIIRELMITAFRTVAALKKVVLAADSWGKIKAALQMVGLIVYMIYPVLYDIMPVLGEIAMYAGFICLCLATVSAIVSAMHYIIRYRYVFSDEYGGTASISAGIIAANPGTIAVAESFTGGGICSDLVSVPGASKNFIQGKVCYSDQSKISELDVSEEIIASFGPVSRETAESMLRGIKNRTGADYAVITTGNAGPSAEKSGEVGDCYIGVAGKNNVCIQKFTFTGDRTQIIGKGIKKALIMLSDIIKSEQSADFSGGNNGKKD